MDCVSSSSVAAGLEDWSEVGYLHQKLKYDLKVTDVSSKIGEETRVAKGAKVNESTEVADFLFLRFSFNFRLSLDRPSLISGTKCTKPTATILQLLGTPSTKA